MKFTSAGRQFMKKDINGNTYARSKEQEEEKKERSNNFQSYGEAEKQQKI